MVLHTLSLIAFFAAATAPTPLYPLYQERWGFSSFILTVVFAVYLLPLLGTLLCLGSVSDKYGRRSVILFSLFLEIGAMGLFLSATDVRWLIGARLLQGLATGLGSTALAAALVDADSRMGALVNSIAPMAGMATGALGSGFLAQYSAYPMIASFSILLATFTLLLPWNMLSAETLTTRNHAIWLWRPRIAIPASARGMFLRVFPLYIAAWALGGFYMALMPSLLRALAGPTSDWMAGVAMALLTLSGAIAILFVRRKPVRFALDFGAMALCAGAAILLAAIATKDPLVFFLGSLVAGGGFGAGFLGALNSIVPLAAVDERAGLLSAVYLTSYAANASIAVAGGYMAQMIGVARTAEVNIGFILVLSIIGFFASRRTNG